MNIRGYWLLAIRRTELGREWAERMLRQMVWSTCAKLVAIDMAVWDRKSNLLINEIAFMLFVFTSSKTAHGALCVLNDARYPWSVSGLELAWWNSTVLKLFKWELAETDRLYTDPLFGAQHARTYNSSKSRQCKLDGKGPGGIEGQGEGPEAFEKLIHYLDVSDRNCAQDRMHDMRLWHLWHLIYFKWHG